MKHCELCKGIARMYCESDNATLCWECDAKVHSANFLAARHSRCLLCHVCQSPTAWSASGSKLGQTLSVCDKCVDGYRRDEVDESESVNDEGSDTEEEESDSEEDEDDEEIDEEDIQVVPWSSTPPPPPACSSCSDDSSTGCRNVNLKRMREDDADLHSDDDSGSSSCSGKLRTSASEKADGGDVAAAVVGSRIRTPAKIQRRDRDTAIMEFIMRNNGGSMSSSAAIGELCRLSDDSRTVDLESSETS